ncbi:SIR2 family protein [Achromobacter denitrificans]|uniref:SIR2 family protein n=1 Tax=Achromobacter denitrificans TaxID=32002 RepID=UPI0023E7B9B8|nr:SIR2 family protein [Achromobacter denitrificans]MDF3860457.1 SIR2 family protein [Achromobacter denitrificans]
MSIKDQLIAHFAEARSAPFLFVGSGFSRRYLGLEDWGTLLRRFSHGLKPYEYYLASADGDLPTVATLLASDFHHHWWAADEYKDSRDKNKSRTKDATSALRIEICNYLSATTQAGPVKEHAEEVALLSKLNVDGIVTTNWDTFLEGLFPDYKVFVGQNELLFSNTQAIGEIYKIHGSASRPASLVLTKEDYTGFQAANPYLAAKLITIFVEHPVVFVGYSLNDPNVLDLLRGITCVLGQDTLAKLQNNLIFVQRAHGEQPQYSKTLIAIDGGQLPITIVKSDSFIPVYEALYSVKRKIPARVLRYCKEQLYEMVRSTEPSEKMCVVDVDDIDKKEDIEFVIGVGVASEKAGQIGYHGISILDLFKDFLSDTLQYDAEAILRKTIPDIGKSATYIPVFRYLREMGITSQETYKKSGLDLSKHLPSRGVEHYRSRPYAKPFLRTEKDKSTAQIIESNPPEKAAMFLPYIPKERFDVAAIRLFLQDNIDRFDSGFPYATYFRKLACLCDYYQFGWTRARSDHA